MAQQAYGGPTSLGFSRYASPIARKAQLAAVPATVSTTPTTPTKTIATREQIAAGHGDSIGPIAVNGGAQLAAAQGRALKEEIDRYGAKFSRTVSTAVANTRQLLELVREAVNKEDPSALKTIDDLWTELEQLFEAAKGSKAAMAHFLEKQKSNMTLYHAAVVNETYRETQEELNMQCKKTNLQHDLILGQQEVFQDYKAQTDAKLKEIDELHEKASRLTLANGHLKGELDGHVKLQQQAQSKKEEDLKKIAALKEEIGEFATSKKQLLAEIESLRKMVDELQWKSQTTERQLTDKFVAELKEKSDLFEKETAKSSHLDKSISTMHERENSNRVEMAKLKAENKQLIEKSANMAAEHSQAFLKSNEQTKKIESMTSEADRLRKDNGDMIQRLKQLLELEKEKSLLVKEKSGLLEQVDSLSVELKDSKEGCMKINMELAAATEQYAKLQKNNNALKAENDNFVAKQANLAANSDKATAMLKDDNAKLKAMVAELKANQAAPAVGGTPISSAEKSAYEEKITGLEEQKTKIQGALSQWQRLAKESYDEYKVMLPLYKKAEQFRDDALAKDEEITNLKSELANAKTSHSSDGVASGDAGYWKGKYENLLASVGN